MINKILLQCLSFCCIVSLAACGGNLPPTSTATPTPAQVATSEKTGTLTTLPGTYQFTEGPTVDPNGNVYFSDINAGKIYKWSTGGEITVFRSGLNKPNGLAFDKSGNLIVCEGGSGRLIALDAQGQTTVLVEQYHQTRFNEPNDLWIDSQGGIYFTDPVYQSKLVQDGEHVYYLSPDRSQVTRVINDLVRPNGIVGTPDGKTLYVADHGAGKIFTYTIASAGNLSNKRLFAATGSDGMKLDANGNLYLAVPNQVKVFDANGNPVRDIPTPENPTNVAFGGTDQSTLFITARTAVYTLLLPGSGSASKGNTAVSNAAVTSSAAQGFTLTSPDLGADGRLPVEYTCDGASATLALNWSGAPAGTQGFAVIMHHEATPQDIHWYWVVYNLPPNVTSLVKNSTGIGSLGTNSVNGRLEYSPPCSKGPGDKAYIYTVYALSGQPQFSVLAAQVNRAVLLAAIQKITLTSAELRVTYARPSK